jgi:hypothetical protein
LAKKKKSGKIEKDENAGESTTPMEQKSNNGTEPQNDAFDLAWL